MTDATKKEHVIRYYWRVSGMKDMTPGLAGVGEEWVRATDYEQLETQFAREIGRYRLVEQLVETCHECRRMLAEWSYEPPNEVNEDCARGIEP
jgi:hypothetical protein